MIKPNKKCLVWVTWTDAVADSSRIHVDELSQVSLATNVNLGWIIDEDDKRVILAHGYSTSGEIDYFAIPKGDIISMEGAAYTPRKVKKENKDE